jgi:hypothetical protein
MAGHTSWAEIREARSRPGAVEYAAEYAAAVDAELKAWREEYQHRMAELRSGCLPTQSELIARLDRTGRPAADAALQDDPRISALRDYIETLGGELEIVADLGDERITLTPIPIEEHTGEAVAA